MNYVKLDVLLVYLESFLDFSSKARLENAVNDANKFLVPSILKVANIIKKIRF